MDLSEEIDDNAACFAVAKEDSVWSIFYHVKLSRWDGLGKSLAPGQRNNPILFAV